MVRNWIRQAVIVVGVVCLQQTAALGRGFELLEYGHYDLRFGFAPEAGWHYGIYDYYSQEELSPWHTVLRVTESARHTIGPAVDFLGSVGAPFWVLPEVLANEGQEDEILWLGFGSPDMQRDIFTGGLGNRGRLSLRLLTVSGSGVEAGGRFVLYQSDFPRPRILFSYIDGQVGGDQMPEGIVANFHAHYNWAFTQPGTYHVRFEVSGQLVPTLGGSRVATEVMFSFVVGEPDWTRAFPLARPLGGGWLWQPDQGFIHNAGQGWYWLPLQNSWRLFPGGDPSGYWSGTQGQSGQWHWSWHHR